MFTTFLADSETINLVPQDENFSKLGTYTIGSVVAGLVRVSLVVAAIVFFFILVIGGIKWISSGGDKGQTESARNQITAALVGLVIVFAAWAIIQLVQTFFGINLLDLTIETISPTS